MKKIISLVLVLISVFLVMSISAYAETPEENIVVTVDETDFIFRKTVSDEFQAKFIANYFNTDTDGNTTYGLTCTLFGHNIDSSIVTTVTHKVSSSDPRCLRKTYNSEVCTRCDYTNSTLIETTYISCC